MRMVTISVALYNRADITKKFIQRLEDTIDSSKVEYVFVNNGSTDSTEEIIFKSKLKNKIYIASGINRGFGWAHNRALEVSNSQYFCVLNNDILFENGDWLYKMVKYLEDHEDCAIVGLEGNPCSLRETDGSGYIGKDKQYVDGACMVGVTELFRKYGLFSPTLKMFYYEDSEISIRYSAIGYKLGYISVPHHHIRGETLKTIDEGLKSRVIAHNKDVFMKRFGTYLRTKQLVNRVLIRGNSHGIGDLVCLTPVLEAVRRDWPTANIELETNVPDVFVNNPHISGIFGARKLYNQGYDQKIELDLNYSKYDLIVDNAAKVAGTVVLSKKPQLFLTRSELDEGFEVVDSVREESDDKVVGVSCLLARKNWAGRSWVPSYVKELIEKLQKLGLKVIELGKGIPSSGVADLDLIDKTDLRQLFSVVANLDFLVTVDSLIFHCGQAFSIPSVVLFGATEPYSRVVDFTNTYVVRDENLGCIGCYQEKGKSTYNSCNLGTEACLENIKPDQVISIFTGEVNPLVYNTLYLHNFARKVLNGEV